MCAPAAEVIAKSVQKSPNFVTEPMLSLFKALKDSNPYVRNSVVEAIVEAVQVSPSLAGYAMSSLL